MFGVRQLAAAFARPSLLGVALRVKHLFRVDPIGGRVSLENALCAETKRQQAAALQTALVNVFALSFEVAYVKMWPMNFIGLSKKKVRKRLDAAEYTIYAQLLRESKLHAILNEKPPAKTAIIDLPEPLEGCIVPQDVLENRKHPDVRIARRAATIASLAKVISERSVSKGLRITLCTQARRLLALAERRSQEIHGDKDSSEKTLD